MNKFPTELICYFIHLLLLNIGISTKIRGPILVRANWTQNRGVNLIFLPVNQNR